MTSKEAAARFPEVHRERVGGVPIFRVDAPEPFAAGLVFRVGRSDETLALSGVTHVVEHLALPVERVAGIEFNGAVLGQFTAFWAEGEPAGVLELLERVARSLRALPLDRLETERGILLTEASGWQPTPASGLAALRFGAAGHGLVGHPELGLHRLAADEVAAWAAERFAGAAAAVHIAGTPPRGLRLELPDGERRPAPEPEALPMIRFPCAYTGGPSGGVALSFVAPRSPELAVAVSVAEGRLERRLRHELGLSYHVHCLGDPLGAASIHGVLGADCLDARAPEAAAALVGVLEELAMEGPTAAELERDLADARRRALDPREAAGAASFHALEALLGRPFRPLAELLALRAAVTSAGAAAALAAALDSALLVTPAATAPAGFGEFPRWSEEVVTGRRHRAAGLHLPGSAGRRTALVVGEDGVSVVTPTGAAATVRFADCVALQRWPDGSRTLWGRDGAWLAVEPSAWRRGGDAVEAIDAAVAAETVVAMPVAA
jgi:predicted Zn-dependent peptidase